MKRSQASITAYFAVTESSKKTKTNEDMETHVAAEENESAAPEMEQGLPEEGLPEGNHSSEIDSQSAETASVDSTIPALDVCVQDVHPDRDFGRAVKLLQTRHLTDAERLAWLTDYYVPASDSELPCSVRTDDGRSSKRFLKLCHLKRTECSTICYSPMLGGLFCRSCVLFAVNETGKSRIPAESFVRKPYTRFGHLFGKETGITHHISREYHKIALMKANTFVKMMEDPARDIKSSIDSAEQKALEQRRAAIRPIIETAVCLVRMGVAFRGDKDFGELKVPENCGDLPRSNGNFRVLLQARMLWGDESFKNYMINGPKNARYVSKTAQNQLIDCIGKVILAEITRRVSEAKYFSVMADETMDVSGIEQLAICLRYLHCGNLREDFVGFVALADQTAASIKDSIMQIVEKDCKLSMKNVVGLCFDGAATMAGCRSGVQSLIKAEYPAAVFVHCSAHAFNLSLTKASSVDTFSTTFGLMSHTASFFRNSAKRTKVLQHSIEALLPSGRRKRLSTLCDTRWMERHSACTTFTDLYIPVLSALKKLKLEADMRTRTEATTLYAGLAQENFVFDMVVLNMVMGKFEHVSAMLQSKSIDLRNAMNLISTCSAVIDDWLAGTGCGSLENVKKCFDEIKLTANSNDHQILQTSSSQSKEFNAAYVKKYNDFLSEINKKVKDYFKDHEKSTARLSGLLPAFIGNTSQNELEAAARVYYRNGLFDETVTFDNIAMELETWTRHWKPKGTQNLNDQELAADALSAIENCNDSCFPSVNKLLRIFVTIAVSTASVERCFSSLRYLKNYLRSSMTTERLSALALGYVHEDIAVTCDAVLVEFAKLNHRLIFY